MKKILLGIGVTAALFTASCSKETTALEENTWMIDQKKFSAERVSVSQSANLISAVTENNSVNIKFKRLPNANAPFKVSEEAYEEDQLSVQCILSGSVIYNSIGGSTVQVAVTGGKYSMMLEGLRMVNADQPADTATLYAFIVEQ